MIRNHAYECDHGQQWSHFDPDGGGDYPPWCPGGKRVTITEALEWALTQGAKVPAIKITLSNDVVNP